VSLAPWRRYFPLRSWNTTGYSVTPALEVYRVPTNNPRINITLSPSLDLLIERFAGLQRVSKSQVIREFIEAAEPSIQRACALMEAAQGAPAAAVNQVATDMRDSLRQAERAAGALLAETEFMTRDLVAEAEAVRGKRPGKKAAEKGRGGPRSAGGTRPASKALGGAKRSQTPLTSKRGVKS